MANSQATFGFKHIGYLGGGAPDYQYSNRAIAKNYSTAIGFGDPVFRVGSTSAYIAQASNATTNPIEGIFYGCTFQPTGGNSVVWSPGWPGNTVAQDATAYIIDAPNAIFLAATLLTSITTGQIGQLVGFTTGTPNTTGAMNSIATVDQSTLATTTGTTTNALPFRVYGMYNGIGNGSDTTTNYNWVVVSFNNQINRSFSGY